MPSTPLIAPAPLAREAFVRSMRRVASSVAVVATNGPAGSEVNNRTADYGMQFRKDMPVLQSTKAFKTVILENGKRVSVGDFIDETTEEKNQRSSD